MRLFNLLDKDAVVPTRATAGSAGFDLYALTDAFVEDGDVAVVSTGVSVDIPDGHYALVCSRSGLAAKYGVFVLNAPGIIDSDYRQEIKVILAKFPNSTDAGCFKINKGDRIAQLVFAQCDVSILSRVTADAERTGGLGSTGI
jgi:dUTP pyrophosphatase